GNTLSGGGRTNTWDGENRLVGCSYQNGLTTHTSAFTNGSDGLRRRSVVDGVTTDFVLDGDKAVREISGGVNAATYLGGARGPEYRRNGSGAVEWYLYDGLGSVVGTVSNSGAVLSARKYDVYGSVRLSSSVPAGSTRHKFCGGLGHPSEDETGLIYMRARY